MDKDNIEIIPPQNTNVTPASLARQIAKNAVSGAMEVLHAAHQRAVASLDQTMDASLASGLGAQLPKGTEADSQAMAQSMREDMLSRMEKRTWMLADALQRSAIVDICNADAVVCSIQHATATRQKDRG